MQRSSLCLANVWKLRKSGLKNVSYETIGVICIGIVAPDSCCFTICQHSWCYLNSLCCTRFVLENSAERSSWCYLNTKFVVWTGVLSFFRGKKRLKGMNDAATLRPKANKVGMLAQTPFLKGQGT